MNNTDDFSSAKKNTLLIDCSTIDPSVSQKIAEEAEKNQVAFVDSPVSGGKLEF